MKALIVKDACVLWKQMRIFALILIVMSVVNSEFNTVFIVIWSAMLPYTAMAYDERSHWNQLAAMMPYTRLDLVLSKYVLGWVCMIASVALSIVFQSAASLIGGTTSDPELLAVSFLGGVIATDFVLPMAFRFGVEKGRMVFFIALFGVAIAGGAVAELLERTGGLTLPAVILMPLIAVLATVVSVPLSMKLYRAD